jgi:formylmethanofuran dehydrogenase subunit E
MKRTALLLALLPTLVLSPPAAAQSKSEWIELGTRIHGGFGILIPIGIRIGLDAKERLRPEPRGLTVTYYTGERAPCPCIADGIMIVTQASPGQGTLQVAAEKAPAGQFAAIVIRTARPAKGCGTS